MAKIYLKVLEANKRLLKTFVFVLINKYETIDPNFRFYFLIFAYGCAPLV